MRTGTIVWLIVIVAIIAGIIWWFSMQTATGTLPSPSTVSTSTTAPGTSAAGTSTAVLTAGSNATLGTFLTAPNGMTLYRFTADATGTSNCYGSCAAAWPPYTIASGTPLTAAAGINGTLSTVARTNGAMQVAYNGQPLYFFVRDTAPGQTKGQNITNFGGTWYVVSP